MTTDWQSYSEMLTGAAGKNTGAAKAARNAAMMAHRATNVATGYRSGHSSTLFP